MKQEFLVERQGRMFALYAGVLDVAHEQGLKGIETMLLQVPSPDNGNVAIARAEVTLLKGFKKDNLDTGPVECKFSGIGDASPDNVARMMIPHIIRMAETRAKARALRDAVNVGVVVLEELDDQSEGEVAHQPRPQPAQAPARPQQQPQPQRQPAPQPVASAPAATASAPTGDLVTEKQVKLIYVLAKKANIPADDVNRMTTLYYGKKSNELTKAEASAFIDKLQKGEVKATDGQADDEPLPIEFFAYNGVEYPIPPALTQMSDQALTDYFGHLLAMKAAKTQEDLKAAWSSVNKKLAMLDQAVIEQLEQDKNQRKNEIIALSKPKVA
jgi:hypothetical protein